MVFRLRVVKIIELEQHVFFKVMSKIDSHVQELDMAPGIFIFLVRKNNKTE